MARFVAVQAFDMSTWDLTVLAGASVTNSSSTRVSLQNGGTRFAYDGTGLTLDGSDNPTAGNVDHFGIWDVSGGPPALPVIGISELGGVDYVTFDGFVQSNDLAGLETFLFSGNDYFRGSFGDDTLLGLDGNDRFNMTDGGADTVDGGAGDDKFFFRDGSFLQSDKIDGGTGSNILILSGTFGGGDVSVTFNADTMVNVDTIRLDPTHDYRLTLNDGNVADGQTLTVRGNFLVVDDILTLDASDVSHGHVVGIGGSGLDVFTAGAAQVTFLGNGQADTFFMGGNLTSDDVIDGGDPFGSKDVVDLDGDYSAGIVFTATMIRNVGEIDFEAGNSYDITTDDATVRKGETLLITSNTDFGETFIFDGSAETNGYFDILGGFGDDIITGGKRDDFIDGDSGNNVLNGGGGGDILLGCDNQDTINGGAGDDQIVGDFSADTLRGGAGFDTFFYGFSLESTSTSFDTIIGFNADEDLLSPSLLINAVDTALTTGTLSMISFDSDLAAAVGAGELGASHAVLFTPDAGELAGWTFLVIDDNGVAGYQASQDLVIHLQNAKNMVDFSDLNFI
jgi:Ca2+-binding RTX toxin-like protein